MELAGGGELFEQLLLRTYPEAEVSFSIFTFFHFFVFSATWSSLTAASPLSNVSPEPQALNPKP
jgi:hypothetical protein